MTHSTEPIRMRASKYANVDKGTSCTQSSFKPAGTAFLFIGEQCGRYKAISKLDASRDQAAELAEQKPDSYQLDRELGSPPGFPNKSRCQPNCGANGSMRVTS